jgi:outer membrane protein assembly factor BamB
MELKTSKYVVALPAVVAALAVLALALWWARPYDESLKVRVPGTDAPPGADSAAFANPVLAGKVLPGPGQPVSLPGAWPQFRGPQRDGSTRQATGLARSWPATGPRELWSVEAGEGYAGVAVRDGRVYLFDYDRDKKQSALRCLALADGREIWRFAYASTVKRNHGMTRTVPTVTDKYVVGIDPKCNVVCLDATNGALRWGLNLVHDYGTTIPPWYAGQCPLVEGNAVILAPGGRDALLLAVDLETGKPLWQSPNPRGWKMTHSSVVAAAFAGQRFYVYCGSGGVAGISATDGQVLWDTPDWKISIATVPSPVVLDDGRLFLSGGYNAGSLMLQLKAQGGQLVPQTAFRLAPEIFGATQQTPILRNGQLYGVRPDGQFVCLDLAGKVVWASGSGAQFGLGPYLLANDLFFVMNDSGKATLFDASGAGCQKLAEAQLLKGRESWGPLALAGDRLIARDLTRVACFDVGAK